MTLLSKPYGKADLARKVAASLVDQRQVVLVVEDEGLVRAAAVDMVADLGFVVFEAADATEALAILDRDGRIDILFTDIGLPDMRGDDLARQARAKRPDLRIILASGYTDRGAVEGLAGVTGLNKPYDASALARALRED